MTGYFTQRLCACCELHRPNTSRARDGHAIGTATAYFVHGICGRRAQFGHIGFTVSGICLVMAMRVGICGCVAVCERGGGRRFVAGVPEGARCPRLAGECRSWRPARCRRFAGSAPYGRRRSSRLGRVVIRRERAVRVIALVPHGALAGSWVIPTRRVGGGAARRCGRSIRGRAFAP